MADQPESPRTDPGAGSLPLEPNASISGRPPSSSDQTPSVARPVRSGDAAPTSDTLLSVPAPISGEELNLDERLSASEQRVAELEARVNRLERRPAQAPESSARSYWFWLLFLAVLAALWQIIEHFRRT